MKYDYFAYLYNKHKLLVKKVISEAKSNKEVKFKECRTTIKNEAVSLIPLCNEPIKAHLIFYELKNGKDSSWKNVVTEFYKRKVNDLNNDLSKKLPEIFKKNYDVSLENVIPFSLTLTSSFFTASENKFYSIQNPIAKERVTGLPLLKGSSLKGALRQTAVDIIESELLEKNYGNKLNNYANNTDEEIEQIETNNNDRFFFKRRARLVRLFGNERDIRWVTFKTLLATGGIRDASKIKEVLDKITSAFNHYLRKNKITDEDGNCKGRLIFEDLHFKKVTLDVITPLDRKKRTPVRGPIYYEVVPKDETITGRLIWFPFDLVAKGDFSEIESEWEKDKEIIKKAFERLSEKGIGAKTKDGWGRFNREGM